MYQKGVKEVPVWVSDAESSALPGPGLQPLDQAIIFFSSRACSTPVSRCSRPWYG